MRQSLIRFLIFFQILSFSVFASDNHKIFFETVFNTGTYNSMMTQDKEGFLWIATTGGIIKYDGYSKEIISSGDDSISSNIVPSIFVDSDGLIWIATLAGLNQYDKKTSQIKSFLPDLNLKNTISSNHFNWAPKLIAEDKNGDIWIGTQEGLNRFDKKTKEFYSFMHDKNNSNSIMSNNIWVLHTDKSGNLWIGTDSGLDMYNIEKNQFKHFPSNKSNIQSENAVGEGIIYAITEDKNGNIWVGSQKGGLTKIENSTQQITRFMHDKNISNTLAHNEIFSLMCDSKNNIWINRSYKVALGIEKFDINNNKFTLYQKKANTPGELSGELYLSSFEDNAGTIWFPNNLGSIEKFDNRRVHFKTLNHLKSVMTIMEDDDKNVWLGTPDQGIYIYKDNLKEVINITNEKNNITSNYIFTIYTDRKKNLWVTTGNGEILNLDSVSYEVRRKFQNPYTNFAARDFQQDYLNDNLFWFGTEGEGLFSFNLSTKKFTQYKHDQNDKNSIPSNYIQRVVQDKKGNLWLASQGEGLIKYNTKNKQFKQYTKNSKNSLNGKEVIEIYFDSHNSVWVSTNDGGLNRLDLKTNEIEIFDESNGFSTTSIRSIKEDKNGLFWLTSDKGIIKFDPIKKTVLNRYTISDGLSANQYQVFPQSSLLRSNGDIWFTSNDGIDIFSPINFKNNDFNPPVVLTSIKQGGETLKNSNKAFEIIDEITLDWRHNYFEFEYSALNYTLSEKSQYRYKLEGVDNDWYYASSRRFGRYSGLNGGTYILRVQGTNNDGIWSNKEAVLTVNVIPAFWQTLKFKLLLLAVFIGSIYIFFYLKMFFIKRKQEELEEKIEQRTEELNEKNIKLTDSIVYAKRIQNILLPDITELKKEFQEVFLLYMPKDIVSGDFHWYCKKNDDIFIVVADCTGHGVPGALLASIGNMLLNKHIKEQDSTSLNEILENIDRDISAILNDKKEESFESIDLSICKINKKNDSLSFAGARNSMIYTTKSGELNRIKGSKRSLGGKKRKKINDFDVSELDLSQINSLYFYSDGYVDQLNDKNHSFKYKKLKELLEKNQNTTLNNQSKILNHELIKHMENQEQTDDIIVMGIRI